MAAERGPAEIVEILLHSGADPRTVDNDGRTALHCAAKNDVDTAVQLLISSDCIIEAKDNEGKTPLMVAIESKSVQSSHILVAAGADTTSITDELHKWLASQPWWGDSKGKKQQQYYPSNAHEQLEAAFVLKKVAQERLPATLISYIFDLANYWIKSRVQRATLADYAEHDGSSVYLRSQSIVGTKTRPLRKLVFEIVSHDQGWSDTRHTHGTYNDSYTWFEAVRESGSEAILGPEIFCNVQARNTWRKHVASWHFREGHHHEIQGSGIDVVLHGNLRYADEEITTWFKQLKAGDRLCIVPRAQFVGWRNYVQSAKLEVYTTCLRLPLFYVD